MYDSSITCRKREGRRSRPAGSEYACELVSPILTYHEDIGALQDIVRRLRKAGGMTNNSCGIHVHLDGEPHTPRSIRNFINLIASRNDLFYKALQIEPERMHYCKKMDEYLVEKMNHSKPKTFAHLENIWYSSYSGNRNGHYHNSRYVAYGSNMNVEQMQHRCPTAKVVTSMFLEGYRLRFMGGHYSAVATIEPSDDDLVPITVWEIYPEDERNLDIYEGYPHLYRKETLKLKLGKKTFSAMVYIINGEKMLYGQPSKAYFETIREGYISAGFDPKLLHQAVAENCTEVRLYG